MPFLSFQRGITLIEVLIAVVIFGIGLLGVAALLLMAARSEHAAYLRTQVSFLAQGMAERMRANSAGVWGGDYNGAYPGGAQQDCAAGCTPRQLAQHDRGRWSSQLITFLPPGVEASIACHNGAPGYTPTSAQWMYRPSYGGTCSMTISWSEQGNGAPGTSSNDHALQTFAWEFQP